MLSASSSVPLGSERCRCWKKGDSFSLSIIKIGSFQDDIEIEKKKIKEEEKKQKRKRSERVSGRSSQLARGT